MKSATAKTPFEDFLNTHTEAAWSALLADLVPSVHEVDKAATQIWFAFYPLALQRALTEADDPAELAARLLLKGRYYLKDRIDSSHRFLYGHRYWPEVKRAVEEHAAAVVDAEQRRPDLAGQIREVAKRVASSFKAQESLLTGITAVAFMTLQQVGAAAFKAAPGAVNINAAHARKSPEQVLKERAKDDSQGLFGFLRTVDKVWTVTYDENDPRAKYKLNNAEDLASGAARDRSRDWRAEDPRCVEGPIPVECRSASCGTCWVGVLGGAEKLAARSARERKRMKEFGYIDTDDPRPIIRLACMAEASGAVSIVIPSWNGVFGKYLAARKANGGEASDADANPSGGLEE